MPTPTPKQRQCRVLNPRGIPPTDAGGKPVPVIGYTSPDGTEQWWHEGEIFTPPDGFDADGRLRRDGFYEEVT